MQPVHRFCVLCISAIKLINSCKKKHFWILYRHIFLDLDKINLDNKLLYYSDSFILEVAVM